MKSRLDDYCPEFKRPCRDVACVVRNRFKGYVDRSTGEAIYSWEDDNSRKAIITECGKFNMVIDVVEEAPCKN